MAVLDKFEPDNLLAGSAEVTTGTGVIQKGQNLVRGTVLGLVTATKELVAVDSAATDGSEKPYTVLAEDVDATEIVKPAAVYLTGTFNRDALTFGGTDTADNHKKKLREIGIFLKTNQEA